MEKLKFTYILLERDINTIAPKDCVGTLFKNKNDVLNIPETIEDVQKSHAYFDNKPQHLYFLIDHKIKINDWFIPTCNNKDLNQIPLQYLGSSNSSSDIINVRRKTSSNHGDEFFNTTINIFNNYKVIAATTNESLGIAKISLDWLKDWFVHKRGIIDPKTRIMVINKKIAISKNDEVLLVMENSIEKTIMTVSGRQPIFEIVDGISAGETVKFGIARNRNPDSSFGEFSQYNLESHNRIEEVLLDDNMKKILLEDICAYYGKNAFHKLKEFNLLNF